ncbi:Cd(II)/Pb(II)-responsive transcriptional regulator [Limnohabitans sp. Rim8]|jgi:Cd(II)/Pb(II)-responsive transcriptional regulator|uniref:Cd(II)/Pb(II)-responsive transcriptional regulator n=1 Tax=Limnohabitans sp. Rim8 TaxID=1100718 RepID=UPI000D348C2A|nr:Cd(II)/Pb(II)-responsive transcriptional regulator [Limnohabitans sp. Rim8]PUE61749.1 Cd(II)/Pb(II)-responsive transcriptional regulator [Limnohabitans sp. Rim8]
MKIGELAKTTHTQVETIRYYEREGLLPETVRTEGNYRIYSPDHATRLSFIRHCRSLDMTLNEIRTLLTFKDAPQGDCAGVNELVDAHIAHVASRIKELKALERQLKELRQTCTESKETNQCGILAELSVPPRKSAALKSIAGHISGTHA